MKIKKISKRHFYQKMEALNPSYGLEIENYIKAHEDEIHHFEYGHDKKLHIRVYRVILDNGYIKAWGASRTL